ncbi:MAG: hypothetical protein NVSMB31_19470 [Vulcanimicrobiaceae bacterium]
MLREIKQARRWQALDIDEKARQQDGCLGAYLSLVIAAFAYF